MVALIVAEVAAFNFSLVVINARRHLLDCRYLKRANS